MHLFFLSLTLISGQKTHNPAVNRTCAKIRAGRLLLRWAPFFSTGRCVQSVGVGAGGVSAVGHSRRRTGGLSLAAVSLWHFQGAYCGSVTAMRFANPLPLALAAFRGPSFQPSASSVAQPGSRADLAHEAAQGRSLLRYASAHGGL